MPKYRATLAANQRAYRDCEFEAADDAAATAYAINEVEWGDIASTHTESVDFEDRNLMLDDITDISKADPRCVSDEIEIPGDGPSTAALHSFVQMIADAVVCMTGGLVNDDTGAEMTAESIRRTARHILKID